MTPEFWKKRWSDNEIGFHLDRPNPALVAHWPGLRVDPGTPVLVPLCGKSNDLGWLADAGYPVVGVELSELAVVAFFKERGLVPAYDREGLFGRYRHGNITILQGDFFLLAPPAPFRAVYDRAALIALPPAMREAYVGRILALTAPDARMLLLTLDYPPAEKDGPPFCVPEAEVQERFGGRGTLELCTTRNLRVDDPARFGALSRAVEQVWTFTRGR